MTGLKDNTLAGQLASALARIDSETDMMNLIRDMMTHKEIMIIARRLEAARLLAEGLSYNEVLSLTGMSSRTLSKVYKAYQNGHFGYPVALDVLVISRRIELRLPG